MKDSLEIARPGFWQRLLRLLGRYDEPVLPIGEALLAERVAALECELARGGVAATPAPPRHDRP